MYNYSECVVSKETEKADTKKPECEDKVKRIEKTAPCEEEGSLEL